ncbi:MAG TPA: hypothetical protein VKQ29_15435 [Aliidongia sp.]|nr:hypothetical protein [Aliidongia sp.]
MMRRLLICLTGAAMVLLAPSLASAAPTALRSDAAPAAVQKPIEQARMVRRCHVVKVWRNGPHGRHLVRRHRCHMVRVY